MKSFLDKYMEYTSLQESPDNYHIWCGLSIVAACLRRQTWIDMGYFKVFPNMFIVLVAPAGKCRKTVAINTATELTRDLSDVIVSADSITREALILELRNSARMIEMNGEPYIHSSVTIISKELSVFLGSNNPDLLSLLTDLYDNPPKWEYKTKNKGVDTIQNVWLNMLGASTPTWLVGSIPMSFIGGGFTSRVIFVVEDECRLRNPRPKLTKRVKELKEELMVDLEKISMISGEFILDKECEEAFDYWYNNENIKIEDARFSGYAERKHVHILKVAMILAVCYGSKGVIQKEHFEIARHLLTSLEAKMFKAFGATGRSIIAADIDEVLQIIIEVGYIERGQLMGQVKMNIHPREFDSVIQILKESGEIEEKIREGKIVYYYINKKEKTNE